MAATNVSSLQKTGNVKKASPHGTRWTDKKLILANGKITISGKKAGEGDRYNLSNVRAIRLKTKEPLNFGIHFGGSDKKTTWFQASSAAEAKEWFRILDQAQEHALREAGKKAFRVHVVRAKDLVAADAGGTSDPFCKLTLGTDSLQTEAVSKTLTPEWNDLFTFFPKKTDTDVLRLNVMDYDRFSANDPLGELNFPCSVMNQARLVRWIPLENIAKGQIEMSIEAFHFGVIISPDIISPDIISAQPDLTFPPDAFHQLPQQAPPGALYPMQQTGPPPQAGVNHAPSAPPSDFQPQMNAVDQRGGFPPQQQGGYPPQQQGSYPPQQQGGYPDQRGFPQQGGYPPQQGGYPPQQGGYPPQQGGYPDQRGFHQQGGYPPQQQGSYPPQHGSYPPDQGMMDPYGPGGNPHMHSDHTGTHTKKPKSKTKQAKKGAKKFGKFMKGVGDVLEALED